MEAILIAAVIISPWLFGMVQPKFELALAVLVSVLGGLWAIKIVMTWRLNLAKEPVTICLGFLFLLGLMQVSPLPDGMLATLSPQTSRLYDELIPETSETLPGADGSALNVTAQDAGRTISLYPETTRQALIRLLGLILLYLVVRNNLATIPVLRRLSYACLINGIALSLFGLVQFFTSSDPSQIYWSVESEGQVFGPFVNRNHFAMYLNLCFGLGLGLLVTRHLKLNKRRPKKNEQVESFIGLFRDPTSTWITMGLIFMVGTLFFSLSRGGFLAWVLTGAVCAGFVLYRERSRIGTAAAGISVTLALLFALVSFLGWDAVSSRMASILDVSELEAGRLTIWSRSLPVVEQFPILGTGIGTYSYIEPLYVHNADTVGIRYQYAHNEYLQFWIEGGTVALLLIVCMVVFSLRSGLKRYVASTRSHAGLGIGLLFAFLSLAIHSFSEFGIHIPAIAFLATIVLALINTPSSAKPKKKTTPSKPLDAQTDRPHQGLVPVIAAVSVALLIAILLHENKRNYLVESALRENAQLQGVGDIASCERRVSIFRQIALMSPRHAEAQLELAQAQLDLFEIRSAPESVGQRRRQVFESDHLYPAMKAAVRARNNCPLLPAPHLTMANYAYAFEEGEKPSAHLARVKKLSPVDPSLWFLCGQREYNSNIETAIESWRHSLSLAPNYLEPILNSCNSDLAPPRILNDVLPDHPELIVQAADYLFPYQPKTDDSIDDSQSRENRKWRKLYLEKALRLFKQFEFKLTPEQLFAKAIVLQEIEEADEAGRAFQNAIRENSQNFQWRLKYAEFLIEENDLRRAKQQLNILKDHPYTAARAAELIKIVEAAENQNRFNALPNSSSE